MPRRPQARRSPSTSGLPKHLQHINLNAAGIDVGAEFHYVAVPVDRDLQPVRRFAAVTEELHQLAAWLRQCGIETVVLASTGVYWIPVFEILEAAGFEVLLVDARHVKNVSGRKSDVLDCQWLQQLHTYGLLRGAFRPADHMVVLRSYLRQRAMLVEYAAAHIQHMQKALQQMNLLLKNVVSDIVGVTGLKIIRAILAGERDPEVLAQYRDYRCKHSAAEIAKSLVGNYREEHLFALEQALTLYDTYRAQIAACDRRIEDYVRTLPTVVETEPPPRAKASSPGKNRFHFDLRTYLYQLTGVDLTRIDGSEAPTVLTLISEIGTDMTRWTTAKHFASWLGLGPGTKVSGGKVLSSKTKATANRAAAALRLAAASLYNSRSALGAYFRRMAMRLDKPKAITATAHKLARLVYSMLRYGSEYVDAGQDYYEQRYRERVVRNLEHRAKTLGYELVPRSLEGTVT